MKQLPVTEKKALPVFEKVQEQAQQKIKAPIKSFTKQQEQIKGEQIQQQQQTAAVKQFPITYIPLFEFLHLWPESAVF